MGQEYLFEIRGPLPSQLRSQADEFADLISEVQSRKQLPRLWKLADRVQAIPKPDSKTLEKRRRNRTVLGVVNLLLALFGLGPALIAPETLLSVLLIGAFCLVIGIAALWKRHRVLLAVLLIPAGIFYGGAGLGGGGELLFVFGAGLLLAAAAALLPRGRRRKQRAEKVGTILFDARSSMGDGDRIYLRFTEQGMQVFTAEGPSKEQDESLPYDSFLGILETEDLLLIARETQGFLLAKSELKTGTFSNLKAELSAKTLWITKEKGV